MIRVTVSLQPSYGPPEAATSVRVVLSNAPGEYLTTLTFQEAGELLQQLGAALGKYRDALSAQLTATKSLIDGSVPTAAEPDGSSF